MVRKDVQVVRTLPVELPHALDLPDLVVDAPQRAEGFAAVGPKVMGNLVIAGVGGIDGRHAAVDVHQHAERGDLAEDDIVRDLQQRAQEGKVRATRPDPDPGSKAFDHVHQPRPQREGEDPDQPQRAQPEEYQESQPAHVLKKAVAAQGREGKEGQPGIAVEHIGVTGTAPQEPGPAGRDPLLDRPYRPGQFAHDGIPGHLVVPPKAGDVPVVAIEDTRLGGRGCARQAAAPAG